MTDQTPEAPEVAVEAVAQAPPEPEAAEPVRDEAAEAAIQAASGEALARWAASMKSMSSIRFSFCGAQVGCTMKMSRPRTSSSILHEISPSG